MSLRDNVHHVVILAAVGLFFVGSLLVLKYIAHVLLVVFAGILFAVVLTTAARWIADHSRLGRRTATVVVFTLVLLLAAGFFWLAGARLSGQASELADRLPAVTQEIRSSVEETGWGTYLLNTAQGDGGDGVPGIAALGGITGVFRTLVGAFANLAVVVVLTLYLAFDPDLYVRGGLHLLPEEHRKRGREVLSALGTALSRWIVGRLASMLVVGVLTSIGLIVAGVPLAFVLGLIAGVFSFVPFIGPILAAIPGVLVAASESLDVALLAMLVYGGAQFVESNLITPLIQKRAVYLAPGLLIAAQLLLGVVFGLLGIFLATPLTVVLVVLVQMLYVEDVLGDELTILGGGEG